MFKKQEKRKYLTQRNDLHYFTRISHETAFDRL